MSLKSLEKGRRYFIRRYDWQGGLCALCGKWFIPEAMTRDHIVPRSKGGGYGWHNIQLACRACNLNKDNKEDKWTKN